MSEISMEATIKEKVRALYEMYNALTKKDKKIIDIIDDEISRIQKSDYMIIETMDKKYITFLINRKIKILKNDYKAGEKDSDLVSLEINDLMYRFKHINMDLTEENLNQFFGINNNMNN